MSQSYTILSLREVEDSAPAGGLGDEMEARFARDVLGARTIGLSLQRLKPGKRASFAHRHQQDEEVYVVVAGSGRALVDGRVVDLEPWSALRVAPETPRAFEAGDEGLEFLAFGTHTAGDGEFLDAQWPAS